MTTTTEEKPDRREACESRLAKILEGFCETVNSFCGEPEITEASDLKPKGNWSIYTADLRTGRVQVAMESLSKKYAMLLVGRWQARRTDCVLIAWPDWAPEFDVTVKLEGKEPDAEIEAKSVEPTEAKDPIPALVARTMSDFFAKVSKLDIDSPYRIGYVARQMSYICKDLCEPFGEGDLFMRSLAGDFNEEEFNGQLESLVRHGLQ